MITHGDLFTGIGGTCLGFSRAGIQTLWQVEKNPFCQQILAKNFPKIRRYADVKEVGKHNLEPVDIISGGFPCQDISHAGKQAGIREGTRSGLWIEFHRIIRELRPKYALVENVGNILKNGLDRVLGDLAEIGYDAEWTCIRACRMGAPHRRERIFIVAYPYTGRLPHIFVAPRLYPFETPQSWQSFRTTNREVWLTSECGLFRDDDGVSRKLDQRRLGACGNSLLPQIAEIIGKRLVTGLVEHI